MVTVARARESRVALVVLATSLPALVFVDAPQLLPSCVSARPYAINISTLLHYIELCHPPGGTSADSVGHGSPCGCIVLLMQSPCHERFLRVWHVRGLTARHA